MNKPLRHAEVLLNPGEYYFGGGDIRIRTLLGSCVAVTLWHRPKRCGGMCHFLVPERMGKRVAGEQDGRYGSEALALLMRAAATAGADPAQYEVKVFGGGNMLANNGSQPEVDIGTRNVAAALAMLGKLGLTVRAQHVLGHGHRNIVFDLWSGHVWVRHVAAGGTPTKGNHG